MLELRKQNSLTGYDDGIGCLVRLGRQTDATRTSWIIEWKYDKEKATDFIAGLHAEFGKDFVDDYVPQNGKQIILVHCGDETDQVPVFQRIFRETVGVASQQQQS